MQKTSHENPDADNLFEKYRSLDINGELICLERRSEQFQYWCYPVNARPLGYEGCIMYCFIEGYDEMVFACNPESCADQNVYPLAFNFGDFMRLILACGSANPVEQIVWMNKERFYRHLQEEIKIQTNEQKELLSLLERELNLLPMENPFEYVKNVQTGFDDSRICYSREYYDVVGLECP